MDTNYFQSIRRFSTEFTNLIQQMSDIANVQGSKWPISKCLDNKYSLRGTNCFLPIQRFCTEFTNLIQQMSDIANSKEANVKQLYGHTLLYVNLKFGCSTPKPDKSNLNFSSLFSMTYVHGDGCSYQHKQTRVNSDPTEISESQKFRETIQSVSVKRFTKRNILEASEIDIFRIFRQVLAILVDSEISDISEIIDFFSDMAAMDLKNKPLRCFG